MEKEMLNIKELGLLEWTIIKVMQYPIKCSFEHFELEVLDVYNSIKGHPKTKLGKNLKLDGAMDNLPNLFYSVNTLFWRNVNPYFNQNWYEHENIVKSIMKNIIDYMFFPYLFESYVNEKRVSHLYKVDNVEKLGAIPYTKLYSISKTDETTANLYKHALDQVVEVMYSIWEEVCDDDGVWIVLPEDSDEE